MGQRRRVHVVCVGLAFAGVAAVVVLLRPPVRRAEVSLTTIIRLRAGMSESEVADAFGPPTADRTGQPPAAIYGRPPAAVTAGHRLREYAGERATALVEFDAVGRVVRVIPGSVRYVSGPERVRLRLNWWW